MKVKAGARKTSLKYNGVEYPVDKDGYCEMPDDVAVRAGFVQRESVVPMSKRLTANDPEKDDLVAQAIELRIAPPSILQRWGSEKLREEIAKATESSQQSEAPEGAEAQGE